MNCDKCNIKNRPGEYCLVCWKKKEPDYRVLSVDVRGGINNHLMYTYSHVFTAGSTVTVSNWGSTTTQ